MATENRAKTENVDGRVRGLHNLEINVPNAVLVGETVTLECSWELEDEEALYSVKWYRGREEFYRYIPKELPHTRVFPLPGIEVDGSAVSFPYHLHKDNMY
ncbi:hypothetical protein MSG28_007364 [Choristoneura fumiferana]|uniref:Uncharacterized protein n=1 Tax=Choristoneura fumiferana TaxID=7141 RepID=A0ACC0JWX4_CHOFU|nr:hypothetical protein MSG28_007364 [Choristoneura fumiferana]